MTSGRGGLGNIYVWAAGNGAAAGDNVNYDGYANSRYVIAVAAVDHKGERSFVTASPARRSWCPGIRALHGLSERWTSPGS